MVNIHSAVDMNYLLKFIFKLSEEDLKFYKEYVSSERLIGRCDVIRALINNNCVSNIDCQDLIDYVADTLGIEYNRAAFYIERTLYNTETSKNRHTAAYRFVAQYLRAGGMNDENILLTVAAVYGDSLDSVADVLNEDKPVIDTKTLDSIRLQLYSCSRIKW